MDSCRWKRGAICTHGICLQFAGPDRKPVSAKAPRSSAGSGYEKPGEGDAPLAAPRKTKRKAEVTPVDVEKEALKSKKQKVDEPEEPAVKRRRAPSAKGKAASSAASSKEADSVAKNSARDSEVLKQDSGAGQDSQPAPRAPRKSSIYRLVTRLDIFQCPVLLASAFRFEIGAIN